MTFCSYYLHRVVTLPCASSKKKRGARACEISRTSSEIRRARGCTRRLESCGRILFGTSIRSADGKLISGRKITNGRRNTSGGNLPAGSVRLAKNRLFAPAVSIGPDIIAAITGDYRPSERPEEAKSSD